jgi:hypothetical protein
VGPLPFLCPAGGGGWNLVILPANNPNLFIIKPFICLPLFSSPLFQVFCPLVLQFSFPCKSNLVARKQGRCAEKASAQLFRISDCGFRIFLVFFFNPHSAIGIPQFGCPPGPENEARLMVFARNALASGPGNA